MNSSALSSQAHRHEQNRRARNRIDKSSGQPLEPLGRVARMRARPASRRGDQPDRARASSPARGYVLASGIPFRSSSRLSPASTVMEFLSLPAATASSSRAFKASCSTRSPSFFRLLILRSIHRGHRFKGRISPFSSRTWPMFVSAASAMSESARSPSSRNRLSRVSSSSAIARSIRGFCNNRQACVEARFSFLHLGCVARYARVPFPPFEE